MTQIANTYAQALYSLAKEEGLEAQMLQQMQSLRQAFDDELAFLQLLGAHNLSKAELCNILDESFLGKLEPYLLNVLKILTEKGYMRHFGDCCEAFEAQYNEDQGILRVKAVTAVALAQDQESRLTEKLAKLTGKTITLVNRVDPEVLGGVRLDYDGKQVDGTVKNRLDSIGSLLKNTVL